MMFGEIADQCQQLLRVETSNKRKNQDLPPWVRSSKMKSGITTSTLCRVGWLVWRFCGRNVELEAQKWNQVSPHLHCAELADWYEGSVGGMSVCEMRLGLCKLQWFICCIALCQWNVKLGSGWHCINLKG